MKLQLKPMERKKTLKQWGKHISRASADQIDNIS